MGEYDKISEQLQEEQNKINSLVSELGNVLKVLDQIEYSRAHDFSGSLVVELRVRQNTKSMFFNEEMVPFLDVLGSEMSKRIDHLRQQIRMKTTDLMAKMGGDDGHKT